MIVVAKQIPDNKEVLQVNLQGFYMFCINYMIPLYLNYVFCRLSVNPDLITSHP